jgi:sugar phosphate permease
LWFDRRRGTAVGLVSAIGASANSLAPVLLESLVSDWGWRRTWLAEGVAIAVLVLPVALLAMRNRPADLGQQPDGKTVDDTGSPRPIWGVTRAVAIRTPFFWVVTGGIAATGLLSTAINFHQISLLTARGLSTVEAAANFLPQTIANLLGALAMGMLVDRVRSRQARPRWRARTRAPWRSPCARRWRRDRSGR